MDNACVLTFRIGCWICCGFWLDPASVMAEVDTIVAGFDALN